MKRIIIAIVCSLSSFYIQAQTVKTIAGKFGDKNWTGDNGPAIQAKIGQPMDIKADPSGNLYIVDSYHSIIRRIDAVKGIITTVAGNGQVYYGGDNGPAKSASLNTPTGICFDPSGNLYIADKDHARVRKVDMQTGVISTYAGNGTVSYYGDGGIATAASMKKPCSVCSDSKGNIYIADPDLHCIRKVDATTGIITHYAGIITGLHSAYAGDGGPALQAEMLPYYICVDNNDNLIIADGYNRIRRINKSTLIIERICGNGNTGGFSGDGGLAINAIINTPYNLFCDKNGDIYFADAANYRIRKIDATSGIISTIAGNGQKLNGGVEDTPPLQTAMNPSSICMDKDGNIVFGDAGDNNMVRVINTDINTSLYLPKNKNTNGVSIQTANELITVVNNNNQPLAVLIFSIDGKLLINENILSTKEYDFSYYHHGNYFVEIMENNHVIASKRFVK